MESRRSATKYNLLDIDDGFFAGSLLKEEPLNSPSTLEPPMIDRISTFERMHPLDSPIDETPESSGKYLRATLPRTDRPSAKRQFMKPGKFDGTGSLESFLRQFEVCAEHNQWTTKEKTDFLQCSLERSAVQLLWDFGSRADVAYEDLVERLRQRYGLESQAETFRTQLRCRRQKDRESLADLLHDIRRLVTLAYPAPASETTEAIARDAFLDAMRDFDLSLKVREREPKSLDETFRTAVRLETYKKSFEM